MGGEKEPPVAKFLSFLAGRIGAALATTVVGALCVFMVMKAAPGDPALMALGEYATPDAVAAFHKKWHLDDPIILQFGYWARTVFRVVAATSDRPSFQWILPAS